MIRGGSWKTGDAELRCSSRGKLLPSTATDDTGLRIAISPGGAPVAGGPQI